jgi:hypothetical protein
MNRRWLGPALLATLVACVYAGKIGHPFQWDDLHFLTANRFTHDPANVFAFFTTGQDNLYRPLRSVVYLLLHLVAKGSTLPYHLAGIAFHVSTCLLVSAIAARLLADRRLGLVAAALYGVHPVVADRVANITGSLDVPGVTLSLAALLLFLRHGETRRRAALAGSLAGFALALLYGEEAATLVPLVFVAGLARSDGDPAPPWRGALRAVVPYLLVLCVYAAVRTAALRTIARTEMPLDAHLVLLLAMGVVFWAYVLRLLFPVRLAPVYGLTAADVDAGAAAVAVLLLGLVVVATVLLARKRPRLGVAPAWFLVALLPFSNVVPIGEMMADRYLYHAAAAFCVAGIGFLHATAGVDRRRVRLLLGVVLVLFSVLTMARVRVWESPLSLWSDAVTHAPRAYAARINYGIALREVDPERARTQFEAAAAIDPAKPSAHVNLGQFFLEHRRFEEAGRSFLRALDRSPDHVPALAGLANVMVIGGNFAEAGRLADRASAIDDENVSVHNVRAFLAYRDGRVDEAIREYRYVAERADDARLAEGARKNLELLRAVPGRR